MYTAIVLLPAISALFVGLFGRLIGNAASGWLASTALVISAILSWIAFFSVGFEGETARITLFEWIVSGDMVAEWSLRIDTLTAVMLVVVTTVSSLVHIYSIGYMAHDPGQPRFFAYLSLFTFAMLSLVTADNLLQLFFGWEGVGLASYLLIGFWYHKPSANSAAIKAFVVNRVGDFGFLLGIFAIFATFGTISLDAIFAAAPGKAGETINFLGQDFDLLTVACLLLFMGAMGKSAQFLLHTWLPDAMEGPTPVSALIHAATMVTAGVFLVARMSPLFELAPFALTVVTAFGAITAFFAATVGIAQNDIKRVIAYSTCSQLGYMFVALGVGAYSVGIFHLFTHAFFKALLFLGAGSVIHAMHEEQDLRKMGGIARKIPLTWAMMLIGTLALTGFPLTAGYYSKDAVVEAAYAAGDPVSYYAFWATVIAAFLTSAYSWRLMFMAFHGQPRMGDEAYGKVHESPLVMTVPLIALAIGALGAGYAFKTFFIGDGYSGFWGASLFTAPGNTIIEDLHHVPGWVVASPSVMMLLGLGAAWLSYMALPWIPGALTRTFRPVHLFLLNKWYIDELYDWLLVRPYTWLSRQLWKVGDGAIIDGLGPDGIAARVTDITARVVRIQTGFVYHYAFIMLVGVALIISYFLYLILSRGGF